MTDALALLGGQAVRTRPFPSWPIFGEADEQRVLQALRSGHWGRLQGAAVERFERRFAAMHGCRHGIAVVNGTVALRVALLAAGIRASDEVIVPPYTFLATASAVVECNAVPVFADIDTATCNLDPEAVAAAITPRTRAIVPVHFAGQVVDMDAFLRLAAAHDLVVIEDAAHAHAASYCGRPAGSLGHMATFSFQSSKNLTAGEGGIVTTNDDELAARCRSIHNCGRVPDGLWYEHHVIAGNYRLGELQGALLDAQLDRLPAQAERRERNGLALTARLAGIPGLAPQHRPAACTRHSYHLVLLRIDEDAFGAPRAAVLRALEAEGIPCSAGYGFSLPQQPLFRQRAFGPFLPDRVATPDDGLVRCVESDRLCREAIWLEHRLLLGDERDVEDIARAFEKVHAQRSALAAHAAAAERP
jgi:dTDP-4-amino-4,6-dideoxygalactose transaminase